MNRKKETKGLEEKIRKGEKEGEKKRRKRKLRKEKKKMDRMAFFFFS